MKNGIETRKNGVIIRKKEGRSFKETGICLYHVEGSRNGPWDYLANARGDADRLTLEKRALQWC